MAHVGERERERKREGERGGERENILTHSQRDLVGESCTLSPSSTALL